jgi:BOS complex subunit NCLN
MTTSSLYILRSTLGLSMSCLLMTCVILVAIVSNPVFVSASQDNTFDIERLVQFDYAGKSYGSRRVAFNYMALSSQVVPDADIQDSSSIPTGAAADVQRSVVVVRLQELSLEKLKHFTQVNKAAALLIVLPQRVEELDTQQHRTWSAVETFMLQTEFAMPIYFAFEDENLNSVVADLEAAAAAGATSTSSGDKYHFVVSNSEATPAATPAVFNFQGELHGAASAALGDSDAAPTIGIVANYDTFAAAPGLAVGANRGGSGTIALLQIARIFARLYSDSRSIGAYRLVFILTSGDRFNYAGSKNWLDNADARVLDSMELVVCLDTLGLDGPLHMYYSRPAKSDQLKMFYGSFKHTAKQMKLEFTQNRRKVNISNPVVHWPHEQFARKRIAAITISGLARSYPMFGGTGLLDRTSRINPEVLERNIKFVAESLAKMVYNGAGLSDNSRDIVSGVFGVNTAAVKSWLSFLGKEPRAAPFLEKTSPVIQHLERELDSHLSDVKRTAFALSPKYLFYKSDATVMSVYRVKPFFFDVLLAASIIAYLGILHLLVKKSTE